MRRVNICSLISEICKQKSCCVICHSFWLWITTSSGRHLWRVLRGTVFFYWQSEMWTLWTEISCFVLNMEWAEERNLLEASSFCGFYFILFFGSIFTFKKLKLCGTWALFFLKRPIYVKYLNCFFMLQTRLLAITFSRPIPDIFEDFKRLQLK